MQSVANSNPREVLLGHARRRLAYTNEHRRIGSGSGANAVISHKQARRGPRERTHERTIATLTMATSTLKPPLTEPEARRDMDMLRHASPSPRGPAATNVARHLAARMPRAALSDPVRLMRPRLPRNPRPAPGYAGIAGRLRWRVGGRDKLMEDGSWGSLGVVPTGSSRTSKNLARELNSVRRAPLLGSEERR